MSADDLHVLAVGGRAPAGLNALQIAMCARAEKLEPRSCRWRDSRGQEVGMCMAGGLDDGIVGPERLLALALPAFEEARPVGWSDPLPVMLALPARDRPDAAGARADALGTELLATLAERTGAPIDLGRSRTFHVGHAGGALALEAAASLANETPLVLVGGVDSYYDPLALEWLDEEKRLAAEDVRDGFFPGEAAAFCLIGRAAPRTRTFGRVVRVEARQERDPHLCSSMTAIVHGLVRAAPAPIDWVLTDLNGERHRALDWARVEQRVGLGDPLCHDRVTSAVGDVGAATGALGTAIACAWWRVGCAPSRHVVVALHSDGCERGAFLMEAPS